MIRLVIAKTQINKNYSYARENIAKIHKFIEFFLLTDRRKDILNIIHTRRYFGPCKYSVRSKLFWFVLL